MRGPVKARPHDEVNMAMNGLIKDTRPERVTYTGADTIILSAGQNFKIETSPDGKELVDATVPEGKSWRLVYKIDVVES